jgi:integrase
MSARNKAIVVVMFCSGLRRAEVAALRWADVDTHEGMIHVKHGKGDKARTVPIYGEVALRALVAWWASLPVGRVYVFTRLWRGDALGPDEPITVGGLYYVVRETTRRSGVEFRPHDA